jgi:flagellar protein FlaG
MDITQLSSVNSAQAGLAALNLVRREAPQAPATVAPVLPSDVKRASAVEAVKSPSISDAEIKRSIDAINRFIQPVNGDIQFSMDDESGVTVIKIVDTKSNTVLRQIPTKEALEIAKELDKLQGLLVRDKV